MQESTIEETAASTDETEPATTTGKKPSAAKKKASDVTPKVTIKVITDKSTKPPTDLAAGVAARRGKPSSVAFKVTRTTKVEQALAKVTPKTEPEPHLHTCATCGWVETPRSAKSKPSAWSAEERAELAKTITEHGPYRGARLYAAAHPTRTEQGAAYQWANRAKWMPIVY